MDLGDNAMLTDVPWFQLDISGLNIAEHSRYRRVSLWSRELSWITQSLGCRLLCLPWYVSGDSIKVLLWLSCDSSEVSWCCYSKIKFRRKSALWRDVLGLPILMHWQFVQAIRKRAYRRRWPASRELASIERRLLAAPPTRYTHARLRPKCAWRDPSKSAHTIWSDWWHHMSLSTKDFIPWGYLILDWRQESRYAGNCTKEAAVAEFQIL